MFNFNYVCRGYSLNTLLQEAYGPHRLSDKYLSFNSPKNLTYNFKCLINSETFQGEYF